MGPLSMPTRTSGRPVFVANAKGNGPWSASRKRTRLLIAIWSADSRRRSRKRSQLVAPVAPVAQGSQNRAEEARITSIWPRITPHLLPRPRKCVPMGSICIDPPSELPAPRCRYSLPRLPTHHFHSACSSATAHVAANPVPISSISMRAKQPALSSLNIPRRRHLSSISRVRSRRPSPRLSSSSRVRTTSPFP